MNQTNTNSLQELITADIIHNMRENPFKHRKNIAIISENNKRVCPYCKEEMFYSICEEVLSNTYASVNYFQYGWSCKFQEDDCDTIFDKNEQNIVLYQDANKKLDTLIKETQLSLGIHTSSN
jgi:uncharacterized Zn-finger protein